VHQPLLNLEVKTTLNNSEEAVLDNLRASKKRTWTKQLQMETVLKDKPLVICGSGPSAWEALKGLSSETFDLMALNGAYNALLGAGYVPDYYAQLDSRAFNVPFVEHANPNTKFYLAAQVHPDVFDTLRDFDVTVFHLNTETDRKIYSEAEGSFIGSPGGTIGMAAMALAGVLGYRTIILIGYDSSYGESGSHMVDQPQNVGQACIQVEFDGRWYVTTPTLAEQVMEFFSWNMALHQAFPGFSIHLIGNGLFYDYVVTNQNIPPCTTTREEEAAQYADIYAKDPEYKCTEIRQGALKKALWECMAREKEKLSYLDVSCGRGESLRLAADTGWFRLITGTETVEELLNPQVIHALLPKLPFLAQSYDVVSLIEVIEHLVPDDVEPALRELTRVAKKYIIISAATFPSWYGGRNLHPSARPEREWNRLFKNIWGEKVRRLSFDIHPSPAWIVTLC
jgi:SAM-dependent methyltransferase/uncharacterized Rossmann fold enzyme